VKRLAVLLLVLGGLLAGDDTSCINDSPTQFFNRPKHLQVFHEYPHHQAYLIGQHRPRCFRNLKIFEYVREV